METPSSTRRVTRSQTLASASSANITNIPSSRKVEESVQKSGKKQQQQDRSALIDITNDSPIVGLAMGSLKTPSSAVSKKRMSNQAHFTRTPGSGEALLRGQVKTLLQKVEEEAEMSKITFENRPLFNLQGLITSPINPVAPTPANTPQVFSLSVNGDGLPSLSPSPVPETFFIPQMLLNGMFDEKKQDSVESESVITRALFLDFSEKSDSSDCSSVVTYQGVISGEREKVSTDDDDDASVWSIQVNASSTRDEDDEEEEVEGCIEEEEEYNNDEEEEVEEEFVGDNGWIDDVCEGMRKISVGPKFEGKHVRFIYNSDGEIEEEEEVGFQTPKQQQQ